MYLSVSKIKTFETCKLKYKWQYLDKIKMPVPITEEQLFGKYLHRFIELYKTKKVREIVKLLDEEIGRDVINDDDLISAIGNTVAFLKRFEQYPSQAELPIKAFIGNNIKLGGKIDKLYRNDKLIIIDFKTSKKFYPGFNDLQLKFYTLAMSVTENIEPENIRNIIYFARPDKYEEKTFDEESMEHFKEYLKDVAERMASANTFPPTQNNLCDFCPYKKMCPLYNK